LDIFGYTQERRDERALVTDYCATMDELVLGLSQSLSHPDRDAVYALALEIARIPEQIRGYGHVKARHVQAARQNWQALQSRWRTLAAN
jgi:indolepyruvate ferredoxin oxidoreductase